MGDVIKFGEVKLHRHCNKPCAHRHLAYDRRERVVTCKDCGRHVDPFSAFIRLIDQYDAAITRLERLRSEVEEAKAHNIRRIATRDVDKAWSRRSMVPACPHCGEGIFPEDGFGKTMLGKDYANARRKAKSQPTDDARKARENDHG